LAGCGAADQVRENGDFLTAAWRETDRRSRGKDGQLRGFLQQRLPHHAAAVVTRTAGAAQNVPRPYHGWTSESTAP